MHYLKPFYIYKPIGNNIFNFEKRIDKKIYIPSITEINNIKDIQLGEEIVFSDYDFENNLIMAKGLKNFYKINYLNKDIYFFDNHNHAFYFWHLSRNKNIIQNENLLIHIDEHSDLRKPLNYLSKEDSYNLDKVFNYTNFELNVGNYIIPALKTDIIKDIIQIRNTYNLEEYFNKNNFDNNIILNLDLDFFSPGLDFIDYNLKKKVILDAFNKAKVVTICTSPFFIDQNLALNIFYDLFGDILI